MKGQGTGETSLSLRAKKNRDIPDGEGKGVWESHPRLMKRGIGDFSKREKSSCVNGTWEYSYQTDKIRMDASPRTDKNLEGSKSNGKGDPRLRYEKKEKTLRRKGARDATGRAEKR